MNPSALYNNSWDMFSKEINIYIFLLRKMVYCMMEENDIISATISKQSICSRQPIQ